jgi:hypothetical protein
MSENIRRKLVNLDSRKYVVTHRLFLKIQIYFELILEKRSSCMANGLNMHPNQQSNHMHIINTSTALQVTW